MKKYDKPEVIVVEIESSDTVASTFTESGDNNVDWLNGWASAINGNM